MQMTAAEVATEFGTDARTLRKFLRADARAREVQAPGKGSRWMIEKREIRSLRTRFNKWITELEAKRATDDAPATDEN